MWWSIVVRDSIVGPFQSTFIKGRMISHNYVIAREVLHSFEEKKKKKCITLWVLNLTWQKLMTI